MALRELLGDVPLAQFVNEYFLRLPFSRPGGCRHVVPLADWPAVAAILGQPGVDVLVGREGRPWDGAAPPSPEQARALLAEGYTVGIRHAERHSPGLAALAKGFEEDFLAPVDVHVYCTAAGQPGFGWHYDAEEVFILQTRGRKEWQLRKNTVNPWPLVETLPKDMRYQREIMPLMRCTLQEGDWLYIPGGYWHATRAGDEESISLSVGVLSATALDVFDFLRQRLLTSLLWRQRLPVAGSASPVGRDERLKQWREVFGGLADDLAAEMRREGLADEFLKEREEKFRPPQE